MVHDHKDQREASHVGAAASGMYIWSSCSGFASSCKASEQGTVEQISQQEVDGEEHGLSARDVHSVVADQYGGGKGGPDIIAPAISQIPI